MVQDLQDVFGEEWLIQMGQGYASMNPPMKELERLIIGTLLAHGNNPVLSYGC